jgi:ubiquinone/menaquinone biosynthesis C-methylase UbiE
MNCDGIAPYYQTLERLSFGGWLAHTRCAFLAEASTARHALLCGDGDGRYLARLLRANPRVEVDYVELSEKMVDLARRRVVALGLEALARVRFIVCDARNFTGRSGGYDLIVTHFFLDCFSDAELELLVPQLMQYGKPGAKWIVSEFREAESGLARWWTRGIVSALYGGFRLFTDLRLTRLPAYELALTRAGGHRCAQERFLGGLLQASLWRFAQD